MANSDCIDGCTGGPIDGFNLAFNSGLSGERKHSIPESSLPPLPEPITISTITRHGQGGIISHDNWDKDSNQSYQIHQSNLISITVPNFQEGCYFIRLMPTSLHTPSRFQYEGTLRVQERGGSLIASGDLYTKNFCKTPTFCPSLTEDENSQPNIPVFPRKEYSYYLRTTRIEGISGQNSVLMEFEPYRFHRTNNTWSQREPLTAEVKSSVGPDGVRYWRGDILTRSNVVLGHMIVVRVSSFLRQATIEIDHAKNCKKPIDVPKKNIWQEVYKKAGWKITLHTDSKDCGEEPEDNSWSTAELHQKMMEYRDKVNLDQEWHYHLLAVTQFDDRAFGVMYDNSVNGIDDIPREGAAVAYGEKFSQDSFWGRCRGDHFGESGAPFIRTAIHEIGHAMMLYHPDNTHENYIMQKTIHVARNAVPPLQFPDNIHWSFSPRDAYLLCHLPDIAIRPGGVSFGTPHHRLPVNVRDEIIEAEGLDLKVIPLLEVVPFGAPVRVNFSLINRSKEDRIVPGSLSMKTGHVSGRVIDPSGVAHDFSTIIHYTRDFRLKELPAGEQMNHSITLLWGTQGPLFPASGFYRIIIELRWDYEGAEVRATGRTNIMVRPPEDDEQASAALKIFSTPNSLLALAIGGDHIKKKYEAFDEALQHKHLKPHYALVEAKRLGQFHKHRPPNLEDTAKIIKKDTVMSRAEILRLAKIIIYFEEKNKKELEKATIKEALTKLVKILLENLNKLPQEHEDRKIKETRNELERLLTIQ
jgi:hypothetical protein